MASPCGYHINSDEGLVSITATNDLEVAEIKRVADSILQDPEFDPSLPQLVDLRGLVISSDASDNRAFRDYLIGEYRPAAEASMAIIVNESFDSHALAALYRVASNMPKTELFDDYELALKWLMRREFQTSALTGQS